MQGLDILGRRRRTPTSPRSSRPSREVGVGGTFSDSCERSPEPFPNCMVSLVRAGEAGGDLDGVLVSWPTIWWRGVVCGGGSGRP
jgi:type II secretory pathway component PulF